MTTINVNDSVKVKQGISDPDFPNIDISGFQGRVVSIFEGDEGEKLVEIHWDSITLLKQMSFDNILTSDTEGYDFTIMNLEATAIEKTTPRDTPKDVEKAIEHLYEQLPDDDETEEDEDANERILAIIGGDDLDVTEKALAKYFAYLKKNVKVGTKLTGVDAFEWEEKYLDNKSKAKEYEQKKKNNPSFADTFELVAFLYDNKDFDEVYAKVKRISDKKVFELALWELQTEDDETDEGGIIDDYGYWVSTFS